MVNEIQQLERKKVKNSLIQQGKMWDKIKKMAAEY
jgi:hypothetical protein